MIIYVFLYDPRVVYSTTLPIPLGAAIVLGVLCVLESGAIAGDCCHLYTLARGCRIRTSGC